MKPSLITLMTACLVRPLLARLVGYLAHLVNTVQVALAEREVARIHGWIERESEYHDLHMSILRAELALGMDNLHTRRMARRLAEVKRGGQRGLAA